jgi:hypothetical protein
MARGDAKKVASLTEGERGLLAQEGGTRGMMLSELIAKLEEIKAAHGDLPVYAQEECWEYTPRPEVKEPEEVLGELRPKRVVL